MENITMTKAAQLPRARFARPQRTNRALTVGGLDAFGGIAVSAFAIDTTNKTTNDVAHFRSGRPPV